jgi:hypothetical protein
VGALDRPSAARLDDHVGQGEARQVLAHVIADVGPDAQEHALALVVAGAVLVGFAEITGDDRPVNGRNDLGERDALCRARQHVAATDAALGAHETDAFEAQKDLFEVGLGQARSLGEVADRGRRGEVGPQGEAQQRTAGVVTPGRNSHGHILPSKGHENAGHARTRTFVWHSGRVEDAPNENVTVNPDEVLAPGQEESPSEDENSDYISQPAKVMRIGSMVKSLLDEARSAPLDEAGRARLREIYETSISELSGALSPDLGAELSKMAIPFSAEVPTESELRLAQAQLVGWLEGLFHGIQASLFAQQAAAAAQLEKMRDRSLPPGAGEPRAGTYL